MVGATRERVEAILQRITAGGSGLDHVYVDLDAGRARAEADAADARRAAGLSLGPLDGRLVSVKDLFDVAGEPTRAAAGLYRDRAPAGRDAEAVARLRRGGAVILGRTNMSEFAFSGVGLNAGYGTPGNALDPSRIPGGSSSGAGVSVALGLADIGLGTDTGGSCRIPAALNGIVGFKPSHGATPIAGAVPLAPSLDTAGPLARSVADCAAAFEALSARPVEPLEALRLSDLRFGALRGGFLDGADPAVAAGYETLIDDLARAGASVTLSDIDLDDLWAEMLRAFPAPLVSIEAAASHAAAIAETPEGFDPRILDRLRLGVPVSAAAYINGMARRRELIAALRARLAPVDALLAPTTPILAPPIVELEADVERYHAVNRLMLRNTAFGNLFDLCAISLPHRLSESAAMGLMLMAPHGADDRLLRAAALAEAALGA